jgi:DNA-binding transcriptional LysR family regulator
MAQAAAEGMGITQVPHYMAIEEIARGELVEVLPHHRPAELPISAVMPSARMLPPRVRALLDLVARRPEAFPPPPPLPGRAATAAAGRRPRPSGAGAARRARA